MPAKGQSLTLTYTAWDTQAQAYKTGDTAHHTLYWTKDGATAATINSPTAVTTPADVGESNIVLTAGECTANFGKLVGVSSTANVIIIRISIAFESGLLAAAGLDAIPVEAGINARQALSPILSAAAGVLTGAGTGTIIIQGANNSTHRIVATTDDAGNRLTVVLSLPS